jgi:hypothetical protein
MRKTINKDGYCACGCGLYANDPHEPYGGRNRQLSIKYGMVVAINRECHKEVHKDAKCEKALKLKKICKDWFEENYPELDFIEIFK